MNDLNKDDTRDDGELTDEELDIVFGGVSAPELIRQSVHHIEDLVRRYQSGGERQ